MKPQEPTHLHKYECSRCHHFTVVNWCDETYKADSELLQGLIEMMYDKGNTIFCNAMMEPREAIEAAVKKWREARG